MPYRTAPFHLVHTIFSYFKHFDDREMAYFSSCYYSFYFVVWSPCLRFSYCPIASRIYVRSATWLSLLVVDNKLWEPCRRYIILLGVSFWSRTVCECFIWSFHSYFIHLLSFSSGPRIRSGELWSAGCVGRCVLTPQVGLQLNLLKNWVEHWLLVLSLSFNYLISNELTNKKLFKSK